MKKYLYQIIVIGLLAIGIAVSAAHKKQTTAVPASNDNWPSQTQPK